MIQEIQIRLQTQADDIAIFVSIVKSCYYTQMGCNRISQRAASHSCPFWQPSCTFRRSAPDGPKRLPGPAPTHTAAGRFLRPATGRLRTALIL